jgi:2'-5' RNA ligase
METASDRLRLFFAVPVTGEVRAAAAARMAELSAFGADAKWAEPRSLHLTLRFLGPTPAESLPALERLLDDATRGRSPFSLELDRLGRFGARVVWVGVGAGAEPLRSLAAALGAEAEGFSPHLTLARLRSSRGANALLAAVDAAAPLQWTCPVDRVILYASRLTPRGAEHAPLRERRLGD